MGDPEPSAEEALTKEEIQSGPEAVPAGEKRKNPCTPLSFDTQIISRALWLTQKNQKPPFSVAALMAPKKKAPARPLPGGGHLFKDRMGLGAYLAEPSAFPASVVVAHDADFVVIRDKFPKATVHTLILPRSSAINLLHPFDALADPTLLADVRVQVARTRALVAAELQRQLGRFSRAEAARQAVLDGEEAAVQGQGGGGGGGGGEMMLPPGRDWAAEVICGVHAVPSMSHVHVHVLSRDMHSHKMKHRKHYNSFVTPFLVDIDDFPLAEDDPRRDTRREGYLNWDLRCWRCERNFGNKFAQLKDHLEQEFDEWKREDAGLGFHTA
ncbi:HIT domain-containing protein [Beauveria bassiana ARSEF 2860]|uniref:Aprataxin-like protein n=1 Tax=Beauveria bassiana (strain ARSEF 2860) TaxID=655819 RepID=J5K767_BEAB2|nr:HIT domain-containing protein [Beauveria bassiana ARSEF 2860]EJP69951.1 HIT domain-containing protein [Beauveria bassiana ARSEF 2860]